MKKILSVMLVAVMLISALSVAAAETPDYGTLAFEEEFTDAAKLDTYLAAAVGNKGSLQEQTEMGDDAYLKVEDGKLKVNIKKSSTSGALRFQLFDVPDDVSEFTVVMDYKTTRANASGTGNNVGLVIADNGKDNWDTELGAVKETLVGVFQLFWSRAGATTGIQSYGADKKAARVDPDTCYEANTDYILTITVDVENALGTYNLMEKATGTYVYENKAFEYEVGKAPAVGVNTAVGLMLSGVQAEIESVKVYTKTVEPTTEPTTEPATEPTTEPVETTVAPTTPTAPAEEGGNTGLIIGIVAAVVVAAVVVVVVIKKKKN